MLQGLGIQSFAEFESKVGISPFAAGQSLAGYLNTTTNPETFLEILKQGLANPASPTNLTYFQEVKAAYLSIFDSVFEKHNLTALVYPQLLQPLPENFATEAISETTVSEINIMGIPGVTVPSTPSETADGSPSPFGLIFVGPAYSEAMLLALAHDYEQAYPYRYVPELLTSLPAGLGP